MQHKKSRRNPLSTTQASQGLAELVTKAIILTKPQVNLSQLEEKHKLELAAATETAKMEVPKLVKAELEKAALIEKKEAMRYRIPYIINNNNNPDRKVGADIPSSYLRRMALLYPIARACINVRIRQITTLEWDITTIDDIKGEGGFDPQIQQVKDFFKHPMGHKSRFRKLLTLMIDDILTIDATCFEFANLRGGEFDLTRGLIPIDPTTIALLVDPQGATPMPPESAFRQIIDNAVIGEFTTDEMMYETMSMRSSNPYGHSPMESLVLQAESAMRGTLYNLNYFRESNVPEGFITLPEDAAANKEQVEEWQMWFDAIVAGDPRMIRRLKILPYGATYTPVKKPEDMSFERFEMWLLEQTCAMFEVQPQEIGVTLNANKANSKSQQEISTAKGKIPLANFLKEIFDDIIQWKMGYENLQLIWRNLTPVDKFLEAQTNDLMWKDGVLSTDDWRIKEGLPPIGLPETIMTPNGPVLVRDVASGNFKLEGDTAPADQPIDPDNNDEDALDPNVEEPDDASEQADRREQKDLKRWRKSVLHSLQRGKKIKKDFVTDAIDPDVYKMIVEGLEDVTNKAQVKMLFNKFLDPSTKQSVKLLQLSETFRQIRDSAL